MTRRTIFICTLLMLAMVVAGFFVTNQKIFAAEEQIFFHDGNLLTNIDWLCIDCLQKESDENYFFVASSSNFQIISPTIDLENYINAKFVFKSRTYYGTTTDNYLINVFISEDNGLNWILATTTHPQSNDLSKNIFEWDLVDYLKKKFLVKLTAPGIIGRNGVGFDDLYFIAISTHTNQSPIAVATSSATVAEVNEEINFDGSESSDADGQITNWFWDLSGWPVYTSTTTYSFDSAGLKNILFWVTDNEGATSSPVSFNVEITSSTAVTSSCSQYGTVIINEIYPAPPPNSGEKEWVEIYNLSTTTITMDNWNISDKHGTKYAINTLIGGEIQGNGFAVIEFNSGVLNNSGDSLLLSDSCGNPINLVEYGTDILPTSGYGESLARKKEEPSQNLDEYDFSLTITPTKGTYNLITPKPAKISTGSSGGSSYTNKTSDDLTATASAATSTSATTTIGYQGKIIINEVLPDPADNSVNEFIELKNISTSTIDLAGCYLTDNSKSKYILKNSTSTTVTIEPQEFLVIKKTASKIALNNSGAEAVNLFDPKGELIDRLTYEANKISGKAYAKNINSEWLWTSQPTPGEENVFDDASQEQLAQILAEAKTAVKQASSKSLKINYGLVELEKIIDVPVGSQVTVRGVVSVGPGILGSQYFYLAGSGIQIYSYKKDFPDLKIGDYVEVRGELANSSAGRRIKTATKDDIRFIESQQAPAPHPITLAELEEYEGGLVTVSGTVLQISGRNIIIDDGDAEAKVYINSQIEFKDIGVKAGDKIAVIGIVGKTASGYRLLPRDLADIKVEKGEVEGAYATSSPVDINSPAWYLGAIVAFLLAVIGILVWKLKKK